MREIVQLAGATIIVGVRGRPANGVWTAVSAWGLAGLVRRPRAC